MSKVVLEDSSLVQSQVVMGSGMRRVDPLQAGEELEDDESAIDDDNPSLFQAGVRTKQCKSKLQPLDEEAITDEMSAMQTEVLTIERRAGTGRRFGPEWEEDGFDDASLMQSETTVIAKDVRSCDGGQAEDAEMSGDDDEVSLLQTDTFAQSAVDRQVDHSKILAWDTILAMDVNTEKDEVKQMAATLKNEAKAARDLTAELGELDMALTSADEEELNLGNRVRLCKNGLPCGDDSF